MVSVGNIHFNKAFYKKEFRRACTYCIVIIVMTIVLIVIKLITRTFNNYQIYLVYYTFDNLLAGLYYLCLNLCRLVLPSIPVIAFIFLLHSLRRRFGALNEFLRCIWIQFFSMEILTFAYASFCLLEVAFMLKDTNGRKVFAQTIR